MTGILFTDNIRVQFDSIEDEELDKSNLITDRPVEEGYSIVDHVKNNPDIFSFTAYLTGRNAETEYRKLKEITDKKQICTFSHKNQVFDVVVESLGSNTDFMNRDGYEISIALKQIRKTQQETVNTFIPRYETQMKDDTDAGSEQPDEDDVDEEVDESWLVRISNRVSGWF